MAVGYVFAGVAMICLGMYSNQWVIIGLVAATGFFLFGAQAVMNNFQAMSYQTEVRGTGVGVAIALNRVGGILGPFLIGVLHSIHPAPKYTFFALAAALFLAAVTVSFARRNMVSTDSAPDSLAQLQH